MTQVNKLMGNGTQPKEVLNNWDVRWNPAISTTEVSRSGEKRLSDVEQNSNLEFFASAALAHH